MIKTTYGHCFAPGWGELPCVQPKSEPAWGEPASPTSAVDNGTSAWGKPPGGVGGWGDGGHESSGHYGRPAGPPMSAPCKPGDSIIHLYWRWSVLIQLYLPVLIWMPCLNTSSK